MSRGALDAKAQSLLIAVVGYFFRQVTVRFLRTLLVTKDLPVRYDTHTSEYGSRTNFRNVVNIKTFQSMENVHYNSYI
jgi:hypothetical protein